VTHHDPAPGACAHIREDALRLLAGWSPPTDVADVVRWRFLDLLESAPEAARPDNPGAHLTASALIVSAGLDRVLLCLHGRMHRWVQVGGHCEDSDVTIAHAACREATEESGIAGLRLHPDPIDLDIHTVTCRYGPASHFDVRFAAIAPPGAEGRRQRRVSGRALVCSGRTALAAGQCHRPSDRPGVGGGAPAGHAVLMAA
jgi:hypothetical protein